MSDVDSKVIRLFEQAALWISKHGDAPMPGDPTNPAQEDSSFPPGEDESWKNFNTGRMVESRLVAGWGLVKSIRLKCLPLFAGVQQDLSTSSLTKIIVRHGISPSNIRDIFAEPKQVIFANKHGNRVSFLDAYISIWKAFDELGMIDRPAIYSTAEFVAAMHTSVEYAWPVSAAEEDLSLIQGSWGDWGLADIKQLPNCDPMLFVKRAGMLSRNLINSTTEWPCVWEDLCTKAAGGSTIAELILKTCAGPASENDKTAIRMALTAMRPNDSDRYLLTRYLSELFAGTDLADALEKPVLKINMGFLVAEDEHFLENLCLEVVSRPSEYMGLTILSAFERMSREPMPPQKFSTIIPEEVIVHLDKGLQAVFEDYEESSSQSHRFGPGFMCAFKLLSREHKWDYAVLQTCSSLSKKWMVEAGANVRLFPTMSRKHRGEILEQELGL